MLSQKELHRQNAISQRAVAAKEAELTKALGFIAERDQEIRRLRKQLVGGACACRQLRERSRTDKKENTSDIGHITFEGGTS